MEIAPPVLPSPQQAVRRPLPHGLTHWLVLAAGTILQLSLGTIYAWSYFQQPLMKAYGWQNYQVSWAFSVAIGCLGLTAATAGWLLPRFGPRKLAVGGGVLFGLGYLLAAAALREGSLPLFYLGYGFVGGCGLGLGYVTPVATVARWFPDKKGLATGIVIMGFGFGALLLSTCLAPWLMHVTGADLVRVFAWLGVALGGTSAVGGTGDAQSAGCHCWLVQQCGANGCASRPRHPRRGRVLLDVGRLLLQYHRRHLAHQLLIAAVPGLVEIAPAATLAGDAGLLWRHADRRGLGVQWRGADVLGRRLRSPRPARHVPSHVGQPDHRLRPAGRNTTAVALRRPAVLHLALLRRRLRHHARLRARYVRPAADGGAYGAMLTAWSVAGVVGPQLVALLKDRGGAAAAKYSFMAAAAFVTVGLLLALAMRDRGGSPIAEKPAWAPPPREGRSLPDSACDTAPANAIHGRLPRSRGTAVETAIHGILAPVETDLPFLAYGKGRCLIFLRHRLPSRIAGSVVYPAGRP